MDKIINNMKHTDTHVYFWGGSFSNFHTVPNGIPYDNHIYKEMRTPDEH